MDAARFAKHVIIITGARGMGACMGERFAREGAAAVIFLDVDEAAAKSACARVEKCGAQAEFFNTSIVDAKQVQQSVDSVHQKYGRIDVLINHAGGAYPVGEKNVNNLLQMDVPGWNASIALNISGPYFCARAVIPYMKAVKKGVIVHIGSVNGEYALGHPAYSAAKAALLSLNRSIAVELGQYGLRSNVVSPGTVQTSAWDERIHKTPNVLDIIKKYYPAQHIVAFEDVAAAVSFLASDEARSITGIDLRVDAGLLAGSTTLAEELTQEKLK